MSEKKATSARTRNYACVVYLDSAPENWKEIISELKVAVFISPYHDKDVNPNGEPKKPHHHVLIMFDSVKTKEQAIQVFESFGGVGCEVVNSIRGYARYLCHLDNPEKAQYSPSDVIQFGGAQYFETIGTMADKAKAVREIISYINEKDILYFSDLMDDCSINHSDWFDCLLNSGSYVVKEYIKSRSYKIQKSQETDIRGNNEKLLAENLKLRELLSHYRKKKER